MTSSTFRMTFRARTTTGIKHVMRGFGNAGALSLLTLFLVTLSAPLSAAQSTLTYKGAAYSKDDTDKLLYTEVHEIKGTCKGGFFTPKEQHVVYRDADDDGEKIASKELLFSRSKLRPSFNMRQPAFNETISITNQNDKSVAIEWHDPEGSTHNNKLRITDDMVFDTGFVHLVQQNWQALNNGESINFEFLSSTRAETYRFVAEMTDDSRISADITILMKPAGTILGWLVDPITLGFDKKGRLTDYLGLTNVRKDKDDNYAAHIQYDVPTLPCSLIEKPNKKMP